MKKIIQNNAYVLKELYAYSKLYIFISLLIPLTAIIDPLNNTILVKSFINHSLDKNMTMMLAFATLYLLTSLVQYLVRSYYDIRFSSLKWVGIRKKMETKLMVQYLNLDLKQLDNPAFYNKYTQILNDAQNRFGAVIGSLQGLLGQILALGTLVTVVMVLDPVVLLISIAGVVLSFLVTPLINKKNYELFQKLTPSNRKMDYVKRIFYINLYTKELKLFNFKDLFLSMYSDANQDVLNIRKKYSKSVLNMVILQNIIGSLTFVLTLVYLGFRMINHGMDAGTCFALVNGSINIKMQLSGFLNTLGQFAEHSNYIDNYRSFFEYQSIIETTKGLPVSMSTTKERVIEFRNVCFKYHDDMDFVLKNINVTIRQGEKVAIVGKNGAGKSTFINLLLRFYDPNSGEILLDKVPYAEYEISSLRNMFSLVFQDYNAYAVSVLKNVTTTYEESKNDRERVVKSLELSGLYKKINGMEKGLDTELTREFDEAGIVLSGGETQKLALARAYYQNAEFLICDEPTSNIDPLAEHEMINNIITASEGKTLIIISHRLSSMQNMDKILLFDRGEIVETGTHRELIELNGLYADMYKTQVSHYDLNV